MDMRLSLIINTYMTGEGYSPVLVLIGLAFTVITLFVGSSIDRFIKRFLPLAITTFILTTCLPLFKVDEYPNFILFMTILVGLVSNLLWVFFPVVLVQAYIPGFNSFWFYGLATVIHFTHFFAFITFRFNRYILPANTEFTVLLAAIAAVTFFLLSFRLLFPKHHQAPRELVQFERASSEEKDTTRNLKSTLQKHGLSVMEVEVAILILQEGLNNDEIADRILRSTSTVKAHVSSIYQKLNVKSRAGFMALFVNK
jgi:DNA-binding CsgD family transcriptional regulator